jgi:hypothetical protein
VFADRKADLRQTITLFESLRESYQLTRDRLYARRRGAADRVMVEIDDRLAANARTIESLGRTVECLRAQIDLLEGHAGSESLLAASATSESAGASRE